MKISTRGRYAVRSVIDLAEHNDGSFVPLKEVAERQEISLKYIENIMKLLSREGIIEGKHGKGGGYRLNRAPQDIKISDILVITEGDLSPVACLACEENSCRRSTFCKTLPMWTEFYRMIQSYFDGITIADLSAKDGCH